MTRLFRRRTAAFLAGFVGLPGLNVADVLSPRVTLTSPAPGQTVLAPGSVVLGAVADGAVVWVDFYQAGRLVGWADREPFTSEWSGLAPGEYCVEARAVTVSGETLVSPAVCFTVVAEPSASLTRGPYIMMGHETNRSTIVWRTDVAADAWVEYGLTSAYGWAHGSSEPQLQHEITLTNLLPGQTYHYRVRSGGAVLATAEFRSAKPPGAPVRIAWTADHRGGQGDAIAAVIQACKPDLILDAGDLMGWCNLPGLDAEFFVPFAGVLRQTPFYWTPGNHEGHDCAPCLEAFGLLPEDHQSYSIEYGDLQAIALNSVRLPPPEWLREKLAASNKPWKFVFTHVPSYSASGGHGEWEGRHIRANYIPLFEEYRGAAWITGHSHYYWRSQPIQGVTHLVVGSGGAPIYNLGGLPPYTAGANDTAQVFAYADLDGDFMHIHALDQYHMPIDETLIDRRCAFQLDGLLDNAFPVVQSGGGLTVWAAVAGRYLYLATPNATAADHFIFLTRTPSEEMRDLGPVWAKDGQVMAYDAFLAGHGASMSNGWFNAGGGAWGNLRVARSTTRISKDGVLEGVIDLEALYGVIPPVLYLAAAPYGPYPGGVLDASGQCPAGNLDRDIQPDEFAAVNTAPLTLGDGRLVGLTRSPDGSVILDFLGMPDAAYLIEASSDLRAWHVLDSQQTDLRGRFTYRDARAGPAPQQFYRTRHGPGP